MGMSITWHGVSSDNWNVVVEKYPNRIIPAAKYTQYDIPGRSGDYLYFNAQLGGERNYANYVQQCMQGPPALAFLTMGIFNWKTLTTRT